MCVYRGGDARRDGEDTRQGLVRPLAMYTYFLNVILFAYKVIWLESSQDLGKSSLGFTGECLTAESVLEIRNPNRTLTMNNRHMMNFLKENTLNNGRWG